MSSDRVLQFHNISVLIVHQIHHYNYYYTKYENESHEASVVVVLFLNIFIFGNSFFNWNFDSDNPLNWNFNSDNLLGHW